MLTLVSVLLLCLIGADVAYLYLFALASIKTRPTRTDRQPLHSFAVVIPAHNEEAVIGRTVRRLLSQDYPRLLFHIFVVADHCSDKTSQQALAAGAICLERSEEPHGSKGAALAWAFRRILESPGSYDAVVVFDADTLVDTAFLALMDARLQQGAVAIQGCHRILNPQDAWFSALVWAMFIVDNRFQNLGRANLGGSAKNMGDSICFRADIQSQLGWGEGLTEDYEFRQKLLLAGIKIQYEPAAIGYGEAPTSWSQARAQRARWLSGTFKSSRKYATSMLKQGIQRKDAALLDGAAQAIVPSYSTLTLLSVLIFLAHLLLAPALPPSLVYLWGVAVAVLWSYPFFGLAIERAPRRAFAAILLGPIFILWRTWLSLVARLGQPITWIRTARRADSEIKLERE